MALVIMGCEVKEIPIKPKEIAFDKKGRKQVYVDSKGVEVTKIQTQASKYKWVYENGTEYEEKAYKALNGKPIKEFSKTTLIDKYDTIDKGDMLSMIQNEHTYLLVGNKLKCKLIELDNVGKAISFKYVIRGHKVYRAVAFYDQTLQRALMRLFRGDLRKTTLDEQESKELISKDNDVEEMDLDALDI